MPRRDEGFFASKDGTRLYWSQVVPDGEPKAWLGFVHGYDDHSGRYALPFDFWVSQGFAVLAFDYRGHGKSDGPRGDFNAWSDYVDDLRTFFEKLKGAAGAKPVFLVSHSNGSLIATHFLAAHPQGLTGAVLVSPFYALSMPTPPLKVFAAKLIKGVLPGLNLANELKPEYLSRDPAWQQTSKNDPLRFGTTTPRWFFGTTAAQEQLQGLGAKLTQPIFMVIGSDDPIVSVPAAKAFFETIGSKDKKLVVNEGHRHETLMEIGREQVWESISSWISAHR